MLLELAGKEERKNKGYHTSWSNTDLDALGRTIQGWDGGGAFDNLTSVQLKDYIKVKPPSIGKSKKRDGPPRFRTYQLMGAAELIAKKSGAIRGALGGDVEMVPTAHERAAAAEARVAELESEKAALAKVLAKAVDAKRKADARKAEQKAGAKKRAAAKDKAMKAKVAAGVAAGVEKKLEPTKARLEAKAEADVAKRATEVSKARSRARAVEWSAKLSDKRLKRAQGAEATAKELKATLQELKQEEPPESTATDEEEEELKPSRLFQPMPWKMYPLIWGQHARRTPPTAGWPGAGKRSLPRRVGSLGPAFTYGLAPARRRGMTSVSTRCMMPWT